MISSLKSQFKKLKKRIYFFIDIVPRKHVYATDIGIFLFIQHTVYICVLIIKKKKKHLYAPSMVDFST